ncbi:MAG: hypothetical protein HYV26_18900, partial [Candidatus Hydrogenedentes bacterium]|nr:hypothetical protein [Candidatus Hydrogenedentota bacterium]
KLGAGCTSMEEAANRIVDHLHQNFRSRDTGESDCVLARFYLTLPWSTLGPDLRQFASGLFDGAPIDAATKCFVLLASRGDEPAWNARQTSVGHQAIPLLSVEAVERLPMIARLFQQLGLEISLILGPSPALMVDLEQRTFNVFHVPEALGSPYIPAQDSFIVPYQVRSALGFGGVLPNGELFSLILFTRVPVARETADMFKTAALSVKMAVLPFASAAHIFSA